MKFFTKKTKIVFLVIILIGAVLLAYNSLSYHLDYQPLKGNSSSLGSSLITEGFNGSGSDSTNNNSYYDEIRNNMQKSFEAIAAANAANGNGVANSNANSSGNSCASNNSGANANSSANMNGIYTSYSSSNENSNPYSTQSTPYSNGSINPSNSGSTYSGSTYSSASSPTSMSASVIPAQGSASQGSASQGPSAIPASQIPAGDEDKYILKSQIVPPVCPVCPSVTPCPNKPTPPCPPCGRCPDSPFECKKVPNYSNNSSGFLPNPVLTDFSTFGM
jgi:hypothetical protein